MTPSPLPRILTIAGSDSGGGAGIQADLKVITCLGGFGMSAITALTAQNTVGVFGIHPVQPDFVARQISACLDDIGADAAKTGMLCNAGVVHAVADTLQEKGIKNLVVDPVMISKHGNRLLDEDAEQAIMERILPLARIITPNLPEAEQLVGFEVADMPSMRRAAKAILKMGPDAVIVKGGHLEGMAIDLLFDGDSFHEFPSERIETKNTHGTGCSFSAALATELAHGSSILDAARRAKLFITEAIRHSLPLGKGYGPTNPLAAARILNNQDC
jgi:hydroxymethylpyrimidine kinase/phosphomethylpyrimidine kinase